ncbi:hypothetical protein BC826DRAFT_1044771 [Russula brevipes]|nr:hypothetical protein BC826DRAFT_1085639 [Russula brevipes]KAI0287425.1 hypothetical protein BC826DRAFT_1044771 [Russula brevipes]
MKVGCNWQETRCRLGALMVLVVGGDVAYLYASGITRASDHATYFGETCILRLGVCVCVWVSHAVTRKSPR